MCHLGRQLTRSQCPCVLGIYSLLVTCTTSPFRDCDLASTYPPRLLFCSVLHGCTNNFPFRKHTRQSHTSPLGPGTVLSAGNNLLPSPLMTTPPYHPSRLSTNTAPSDFPLLVKLNALFWGPPQPFACISIVITTVYIANIILGAFRMLSGKFHYMLVRNYYKPHFINGGTEALRTEFISHHTCRKGYRQNFNHVLTVPKSVSFSFCSVASLTASWLASCIHRCLTRGIAANSRIAGSGHAHPYKCG